ncbi:MAG: class I SAM-dependent methyltransferase [Burkholderiales bacterium]|nr:class I SAM-dependent methyltransferase [Burkholderiales bacterium]
MNLMMNRWKALAAALTLVAAPVASQEGQGDVVYVPTPQIVVDEMLNMAKVGPKDFLIDLGSGDGRIVITAAKKHGARGFGVDLDRYLLKLANAGAQKEGVSDRAKFVEENLFNTDLTQATVITTYLLPEMNLKLRPKILALKPGTRVVAHDYHMGEWSADQERVLIVPEKTVGDPGKSYIYLWLVPARVAGVWESRLAAGGEARQYAFYFDQEFQEVSGKVTVNGRQAKFSRFRLAGDAVNFVITANLGGKPVSHRFNGRVKDGTIEGNVTVTGDAPGPRVIPWTATQSAHGEMKMGNDAAGGR